MALQAGMEVMMPGSKDMISLQDSVPELHSEDHCTIRPAVLHRKMQEDISLPAALVLRMET
ncbi:hypothetical protein DSECCO2_586460 [anaerobic digester metagenome]